MLPPDFAVIPSETMEEPAFQSVLKIPATWPERIRSVEAWAEGKGVIDLFLDSTLRPVFLMMAGGLIVAAFVLFAPRVQPTIARIMPAESKAVSTSPS
ncbi:MAG: hypothetical protein IPK83_22760 [Planctomycetes bacterium]|nr:hypothetical protein [Planctomycetota bacterium]